MDKQSLGGSTEANSMRTSYRSISRSGFIQTLAGENDTDMRKSRIYNLPSYKKIDLSQRLDMVVVFQTIQITRLSQEIQTLRVALVDCQRQINNYTNYEIQIRQLNDKVCQYEQERLAYQQEIEKMNLICQQLYAELQQQKEKDTQNIESVHLLKEQLRIESQRTTQLDREINKWKNRYSALQKTKQSQLQQLKLSMESQRKSILNKQLNELSTKYTTEIHSLQKQIIKLRDILAQQKSTKNIIKTQLAKKEIELQNLSQLKSQLKQYQNRFNLIQNQFLKLNDLLRKKQQQQQKYRDEQKIMITKIKNYEKNIQKQYLPKISQFQQIDKNNKELKEKCIRLQMEVETLVESKSKANKLQSQLNEAGGQINRLNTMIKDKIRYIEGWNDKYNLLQMKYSQLQKKSQTQSAQIQNQLLEKQKQLTKATLLSKSRLEQIEILKQKNHHLESQFNNFMANSKKDQQKLKQNYEQLTIKLKQNERRVMLLNQENNTLKIKLNQFETFKNQIQPFYKKQINNLTNTIQQKSSQIDILNHKMEKLKTDSINNNQSFLNQIQSLNKKNIQLTQFADQLHNAIKQKLKQIKLLQETLTKIQRKVSQCQIVQKKFTTNLAEKEKMLKDLEILQNQNNSLFEKNLQTQNKLSISEKLLFQKSQQLTTLMNKVKFLQDQKAITAQQMQQQSNQLRNSFQRERQINVKVKQLEKQIQDYERKIKQMNDKTAKMNQSNKQKDEQYKIQQQRTKNQITRQRQKVQKLQQQIHSYKMQLKKVQSQRETQKRDYESSIQSLKAQNQRICLQLNRNLTLIESQLKSQLDHQKLSLNKLKQTNQFLDSKLKQALQNITKLQQKNKKLNQRVMELQSQLVQNEKGTCLLQSQLSAKSRQLEQVRRKMQERQQIQERQKKTMKNSLETKSEQYEKLKRHYQKERQKANEQMTLMEEQKRKLIRQLQTAQSKVEQLNVQIQRVLSEGRNSQQFIQHFNQLRLQSEEINQFMQQFISKYFITKPNQSPTTLFIEHQLQALKEITKQNITINSETVSKYELKLKTLIDERQLLLNQLNTLEQQHNQLKDLFITLESKNKLLQLEIDHSVSHKKQDSQIKLGSVLKIQSPGSSLINFKQTRSKKNISTLFKSMINSDSVVEPSSIKQNPSAVDPVPQKDPKPTSLTATKSMKNLITSLTSPKKQTPDMIESSVFQLSGNEKTSQYFNGFRK